MMRMRNFLENGDEILQIPRAAPARPVIS